MATGREDVQTMFQKMGEKLGWFNQEACGPVKQPVSSGKKLSLKSRKKAPSSCKSTTKTAEQGSTSKMALGEDKKDGPRKNVSRKVASEAKKTLAGFLSSDTDSDKENCQIPPVRKLPIHKQQKGQTKMLKKDLISKKTVTNKVALKLCSDSDDEDDFQSRPLRHAPETAINFSLIDESPELKVPSRESTIGHRSSNYQSSRDSYDYSVIKNRQSLASMTLNLEELGDPLVESTRIHRRSSPSFQELFDKIDESGLDNSDDRKVLNKSNNQTVAMIQASLEQRRVEHDLCATLENLDIDKTKDCDGENAANDTRYTTAVESIGTDTNSSSVCTGSSITDIQNGKKLVKDVLRKTTNKGLLVKKKKGKKIKKKTMVIILSESEESAGENDSGELVEVVDAETQTANSDNDNHADTSRNNDDIHDNNSPGEPSSPQNKPNVQSEDNFEGIRDFQNYEIESLPKKPSVYHNKTVDGDDKENYLRKGDENMYHQDTHMDSLIDENLNTSNIVLPTCGTSPSQHNQELLQMEVPIHEMDTVAIHSQSVNEVYADETESYDVDVGTCYKHETIGSTGTELPRKVGEGIETSDVDSSNTNGVNESSAHKLNSNDVGENVDISVDANVCSSVQTESYDYEKEMDKSDAGSEHLEHDKLSSELMNESNAIEECEIEVVDVGTQTPSIAVGIPRRNDYKIKPARLSLSSDSEQENADNQFDNDHSKHSVGSDGDKDINKEQNKYNKKKVSGKKIDLNVSSNNSDKQLSECVINQNDDISSASDCSVPDNQDEGGVSSKSPESSPDQRRSRIDRRSNSSGSDKRDEVDPGEVSFAALAGKQRRNRGKTGTKSCASVDTSQQSWRSQRKNVNESSDDEDQLENFFQKLRKPEPKRSDSPDSMKDFIVEDDEMTSESDDDAFYLRENQRLENSPPSHRLQTSSVEDDEEDDGAFSSKVYPDSVTKQKHKNMGKQKGRRGSWPFSSDSECDTLPDLDRDAPTSPGDGSIGWENPRTDNNCTPKQPTTSRTSKLRDDQFREPISSKGSDNSLFKTPNPIRKKGGSTSSNTSYRTITPKTESSNKAVTSKSDNVLTGYISLSDSDSDSDNGDCGIVECVTPATGLIGNSTSDSSIGSSGTNTPTTPAGVGVMRTTSGSSISSMGTPRSGVRAYICSFLKSLSNTTTDECRDRQARRYVHGFKKLKEELVAHLYKLYNTTVFENKLPADMPLILNKRLLRTAGYCAYKKNRINAEDRTARIELSTKVCDSAERVRDTLIHEMCHAAVWILNGVNGGHGPYWKFWARQASRIHPELPTISRCHSYSINTKFTYRCTQCGYSIGRHSKSLDTSKFACGYCKGSFELIVNPAPTTPGSAVGPKTGTPRTPRTPNRFALFVKDNYNTVKTQNKDLKHGDVMKELSKLFAASKIDT